MNIAVVSPADKLEHCLKNGWNIRRVKKIDAHKVLATGFTNIYLLQKHDDLVYLFV